MSWLAWLASVALLWGQHRAGVLHPAAFVFALLLTVTLVTALAGTAAGLWRTVRGPRRATAAALGLVCSLPLVFYCGLAAYTLSQAENGDSFSKNTFSDLAGMAVASLLEADARLAYPYRLESHRLTMFYDDRVANPHQDLEAMDRHVAALEELTGRPLREKIYWLRGELLGRRQFAIRGLVLGSSASPVDWDTADHPFKLSVDRHELAHGVMHQIQPPDADPPTLLIEGWAEAHSGMTAQKRAELAKQSHVLWSEGTGADPAMSHLRELTGATWYHRVDGPVYSVGGAFAEFVLRRYGPEAFLRLYFASRPGTFEEECAAQFGVKFERLESEFWAEVERLVREPSPAKRE